MPESDEPNERALLKEEVLQRLARLSAPDGSNLLDRLVELYRADTPVRLTTLRRAHEEGRTDDFKREAHRLKGSSANLGAERLAALCAELVDPIGGECADRVEELLTAIESEWRRVRQALEALRPD